MLPPDPYELIDFGLGRRLEGFGGLVLDRPAPAVEGAARARPDAWPAADARFEKTGGESGAWSCRRELPETWTARLGALEFELRRTPLGQVGLFPEQAENWAWIAETVRAAAEPPRVLNLFAYTGGSTLSAAAAGAEVVHVDAAKNVVAWARRNAERNGLADRPVRWIVEESLKFCKRELRRGSRYDAVILDPPSYGHGPRGEVWRLSKHLERLLEICAALTAGRRRFVLLTCHTPGYDPERLCGMIERAMADLPGRTSGGPLWLRTADGRAMPSGAVARWQGA
jgi:23S rRNA (cytosine1962-C5)-methyltransferase